MSGHRVTGVHLRGILTSQGETTVEAQVSLTGGATGTASCPLAIAPGRRERPRGDRCALGALPGAGTALADSLLRAGATGQRAWDTAVLTLAGTHGFGTTTSLPLSLAYAKAAAAAGGRTLVGHLASLAGTEPAMPALLVNVFSGGIHRPGRPDGFQQIMVVVDRENVATGVHDALRLFRRVEERYATRPGFEGYSASSGLLVSGRTTEQLLTELRAELHALGVDFGIGCDVAAEHLRRLDGRYRFEGRALDGTALGERIADYAARFGIRFVEDPFDPADEGLWRGLAARLRGRVDVVGDDLFATDHERLRPGLAHAIVLKMNQIGTVSGTIATARRARGLGMSCCVSHRSGETEDTSMCDLAVALGARYIKVGGPRRGDRTAKYNQLLRLGEALTSRTTTRSPS